MKKSERLRIITMSSGCQYEGLESVVVKISPNSDYPFGALKINVQDREVFLCIPHIAVDAYSEILKSVKSPVIKKVLKKSKTKKK